MERFVLDDGWFRHRRDDRAGLGDWYVGETVRPNGLSPLIDHVRALGMEFGLWVEPEMVNPDSDVARAHPEWILATGGRTRRPPGRWTPSSSAWKAYGDASRRSGNSPSLRVRASASTRGRLLLM